MNIDGQILTRLRSPLFWVGLVIVLIGTLFVARPLVAMVQRAQRINQLVVVVTPFTDGTDGQTGRVVANDLVKLLQQQFGSREGKDKSNRVVVVYYGTSPTNATHARAIADDNAADIVIWGRVRPGELLDSPSLEPRITYTPRGPYGPNVWQGYAGRFLLPEHFALSNAPINGKTVVPHIIYALAAYHNGQADTAYAEIDSLLKNHHAINVPLLWVLRGNIEWARGTYQPAIASYQYAQILPTNEQTNWLLANNLSVILFDAGDSAAAHAALTLASATSPYTLTAALAYNQGLMSLHQHAYAEALRHLQHAARTYPKMTPRSSLLLAIATCQRELGQHQAAQQTLDKGKDMGNTDSKLVPPKLRPLYETSIQAATLEQQGLLALAQAVHARGPLVWELEITTTSNDKHLTNALTLLNKALETQQHVVHAWHTHTTAEEVARYFTQDSPSIPAIRVADGQIAQATQVLARQQYALALALLQQGAAPTGIGKKSGIFQELGKLVGSQPPLDQAETLLTTLTAGPGGEQTYLALIAHGRVLRVRHSYEQAQDRYGVAQGLAPHYPESYFGRGMVEFALGNRAAAREWFGQALVLDETFFPARIKLAELAAQEHNWLEALQQIRTVATHYPHASSVIKLASVLRQSGQSGYVEAETLLLPLINDKNAEALIERGRIRRDAGQNAAAIADFQQAYALQVLPASSGAAFEWGQTLLMHNDYQGAETQFLAALKQDANNSLARLALLDLYLGPLPNPRAADTYATTLLDAGLHDVDMLVRLGQTLLTYGQAEYATQAFAQALTHRPDDAMLHHLIAQAHLQNHQPTAAISAEERVLALTANTATDNVRLRADAFVGLGEAEIQQGNGEQAEAYFHAALALQSDNTAALVGLGRVFTTRGNWAIARGYFETAVSGDGQHDPLALFWLAEAQLRQSDPRSAIATYQQALVYKPHFPAALLGLAQAQYALDSTNLAPAMETIQQALAIDARYGEALVFQGKILREQGQEDAALAAYDKAIAANNRLGEAYYQRGTLMMQRENYAQAMADLRRASTLYPTAATFYWLGRAYYTENKLAQAAAAFAKAESLQDGGYPEAQFYRALAEQHMGQYDVALATLEALVRSAQNTAWGERAAVELQRVRQLQASNDNLIIESKP